VLIGAGFWLISAGWAPLHAAQRVHKPATTGIYAKVLPEEEKYHSKTIGEALFK